MNKNKTVNPGTLLRNTNITAFVDLIERYETVTLKEIKEKNCKAYDITGFGATITCTLCISAKKHYHGNCNKCIWSVGFKEDYSCIAKKVDIKSSYNSLNQDFTDARKLQKAFRNRAKVMRQYLIDNKIDITMYTLGKTIKKTRTNCNLTLRQLAEKSKLSYSFLSRVETGKRYPSPESINKILTGLGLSNYRFSKKLLENPAVKAAIKSYDL